LYITPTDARRGSHTRGDGFDDERGRLTLSAPVPGGCNASAAAS